MNRVRAQALQGAEAAHHVSPAAVRALEDAYVVRREERRGGIWYELAHDRLVTPVLKDNARWRDASLSEIEKLAAQWVEDGRPNRLLEATAQPGILRELNALNRRIKQGTVRVAPEVREYITSSRRFLFKRAAMMYGTVAALAIGFVVWDLYRDRQHLTRDRQLLEAKSESLQVVVDSLNRLSTTVYQGLWGLEQTTPDRLKQSVAANQALQTVVRRSDKTPRAAVTIEYFFKRRDPERVEFALRDLGYRVSVEQARAEEVATNAISYGSNVSLADVRIIALAVARTGAQLRRICPFLNTAGRADVVQVIGSAAAERLRPLSVKELESIGPGGRLPCPSGPSAAR
ncbi:MAG TPA: hypothetical protein VFZ21_32665 [Gemmatimonadaceae bacterium]|nr:hypothetical protein [Gemmatimonadaceae bacterium]